MTKVLVIYRGNYQEEKDVDGFAILDKDQWLEYDDNTAKFFRQKNDVLIAYVGTDQPIYFNNYEEWRMSFEVIDLDDDETAILDTLFNLTNDRFGFVPFDLDIY